MVDVESEILQSGVSFSNSIHPWGLEYCYLFECSSERSQVINLIISKMDYHQNHRPEWAEYKFTGFFLWNHGVAVEIEFNNAWSQNAIYNCEYQMRTNSFLCIVFRILLISSIFHCVQVWSDAAMEHAFNIGLVLLLFVLPLITMSFAYGNICFVLRRGIQEEKSSNHNGEYWMRRFTLPQSFPQAFFHNLFPLVQSQQIFSKST